MIDSNLDRVALRKIKETGNYSQLVKLEKSEPRLFKEYRLYKLYMAIRSPIHYYIYGDTPFELFLKKHDIKFSF